MSMALLVQLLVQLFGDYFPGWFWVHVVSLEEIRYYAMSVSGFSGGQPVGMVFMSSVIVGRSSGSELWKL